MKLLHNNVRASRIGLGRLASVTLWRGLPAVLALLATRVPAAEPIVYNRDIRPILFENCFACHGPDSAARKADLRLDQRESAVETGAILPGKPDESELLRRVLSADPEEAMPPPATKKQLSADDKELLRRWLAEGAEYQPHWSLIAPVRPDLAGRQEHRLASQPNR